MKVCSAIEFASSCLHALNLEQMFIVLCEEIIDVASS